MDPLEKNLATMSLPKIPAFFFLEAQIQNGRHRRLEKLTFEPEPLESRGKTLF